MTKEELQLKPVDRNSMVHVATWMNKHWVIRSSKKRKAVSEVRREILGEQKVSKTSFMVIKQNVQLGCIMFYNLNWKKRSAWVEIFADDSINIAEELLVAIEKKAQELNLRKISIDIPVVKDSNKINQLSAYGFNTEVRKRQALYLKGAFAPVLEMALFVGSANERADD